MRGASTFVVVMVLLSCAPRGGAGKRRILHQSFFPEDATPPAQPPSPSPPAPALPFTQTTPASSSPFFPSYPSPPPPPSPSAFASFPANISSLILPQSPSHHRASNGKVLVASLVAAISGLLLLGIFVFLYRRRWTRQDRDYEVKTTHGSEISTPSSRVFTSMVGPPGGGPTGRKLRANSSNRSEVLYLGTLVSSHNVEVGETHPDPRENAGSDTRKMGSPELHPLPPLLPLRNMPDGDLTSNVADDEEFYSPKGSLGTDSGSGRLFAAQPVDDTGSSSSSSSVSPARSRSNSHSHSPSMSPPGSLSPITKSPAPSSPQLSPARVADAPDPHRLSISLTSVSSSPDRSRTAMSPSMSSAFASPRMILETTPLTPASDLVSYTSPERDFNKNKINHPIAFPRMIKASSNQPNVSPSSPSSSSLSSSAASTPERGLNLRITSSLGHPPRPPPPPPPPPLAVTRTQVESPAVSTPTDQPIAPRPPPLIPPSRPFVLQTSARNVSPVELPTAACGETGESTEETPKPKLKPLHWDKVRASSDREMVWDHLKSSSFKLNEEMIESLFVVKTPEPKPRQQTTTRSVLPTTANQENRVLDPKKAQNIAILLRALNVTVEEVCEALLEGNTDTLGSELLESLLKMAPTKEEEWKLKDFKYDSSTTICHAEKFLKAVLDVPFAFKRAEAMLYVSNFETEIEYLKRSFKTLELACEELRNSRMFFKLLEAVLKTGNRMNVGTNRGDAQAFKLDTLLKLVDIKGADGKTTLLHFVVQEIIRIEGARITGTNPNLSTSASEDAKCRKLGLQVVSSLSSDLANVKKAAGMDSDVLSNDVAKLSRGIQEITEIVRLNETLQSDSSRQKFSESINKFLKTSEEEIIRIQAHESVALSLVKEITEYFHGNSAKEEAHPFRIFMVVRDFLGVLDRVCKEVGLINERTIVSSAHKFPVPVNPTLPKVFTGPSVARPDSSSDEESLSS